METGTQQAKHARIRDRPGLNGATSEQNYFVTLQGYLTYKKMHPPRTLPQAYAQRHRGVLGGWTLYYGRGRPVPHVHNSPLLLWSELGTYTIVKNIYDSQDQILVLAFGCKSLKPLKVFPLRTKAAGLKCSPGGTHFGFRVSGRGFRVSGFGIRFSGLRSRVSGFGFQVSRKQGY